MSAVLQENRRARLLYDFSVGEIHYDRNNHPRFIGDGMYNLTGSVAPIDHAAYGHIKGHQKVDNVHIKSTTTGNQQPLISPRNRGKSKGVKTMLIFCGQEEAALGG